MYLFLLILGHDLKNISADTVPVKGLEALLFFMFLKEFSNAHLPCIYLIKKIVMVLNIIPI